MISESPDTRRIFVEDLATESGLHKVRQIVETEFAASYSVLRPMFNTHCVLFLRLVSYDEILSSLILEKAVGTIYNVIYGPGGKRGIVFFSRLAEFLTRIGADESRSEVLLLVSKVLLNTLTLNQEAAIQADLKGIVDKLYSCYHTQSSEPDHNLQLARLNILKIGDLLSMGDEISASNDIDTSRTTTKQQKSPEFVVDLPGELSEFGPRHDNDHSAISHIQILPTISEILSDDDRQEFLPVRCSVGTPFLHHERGIRRLLDTQFRLLREDTSGVLRESIRLIMRTWELIAHGSDWRLKRKFLRDNSATPVRLYSGVEVQKLRSEHKGVEVDIEFDQLHRLRNMNPAKRKQWWIDSRALRKGGTLLALLDAEDPENAAAVFLLVSKREISYVDNAMQSTSKPEHISDVVSNANRAMVTLTLANPTNALDLEKLVSFSMNKPLTRPLILVEFPAVPYNSFEGVLRCLQVLHGNPARMPFAAWLAPSIDNNELNEALASSTDTNSISIQPPAYFQSGLALDLSCLPGRKEGSITNQPLFMSLSHDPQAVSAKLSETTALDEGQADALVWSLRRRIALIQGPPGTGKSYVGLQLARCLLNNRHLLNLGPILCICYTAHALDQFLDGLLKSGISNIIRIGPRSASPHIEALSLDVKKLEPGPRIRGLPRMKDEARGRLVALSGRIEELLRMTDSGNASLVLRLLKRKFPLHASIILSESTSDGESGAMKKWASGDAPGDGSDDNIERSIDRLLQVDVWALKSSERTRLLNYWRDTALAELTQQFSTLLRAHSVEKQQLTSSYGLSDVHRLNESQVVGVTTTQLANNADLLRNLHAKVLICEEAAEVLESHVLTALLPSIQHAILIGDHLQLRPRISNLKLSMESDGQGPKYNLDESLFERLANYRFGEVAPSTEVQTKGGYCFPVMQLSHQRRMHPSISNLVRETLYPRLQDHAATALYPGVSGIERRLFWLDHRHVEDPTDPAEPMQSKTNTWEVGMVTSLVRYLCQQGKYGPGEIAVLTPYVGQLRVLKDVLGKEMALIISETDSDALDEPEELEMHGSHANGRSRWYNRQENTRKGCLLDVLRLATVDNFQGEEASIIIVSLVRSNRYRNCGFLKMPNRINVLLSRAKHGMYIIGDASTASSAPMWSSVIQLLEKGVNIGPKLELRCDRHPNNRFHVSCPNDFSIHAPEGGCAEKCRLRLNCGHICAVKCHSERQHKAVRCMELCTRMRDCGHACAKKCHESCGECVEMVYNVPLPCGHIAERVECKHMRDLGKVRCTKPVVRTMDGCGHIMKIRCFENTDTMRCSNRCDSPLACGHSCRHLCWQCRYVVGDLYHINHGSCQSACGRGFATCSHACRRPCHQGTACPPCDLTCEVRCRHSRCANKCSEPCPPCAEPCGWGCEHRERCKLPCAVPCSNLPCSVRCEKKLCCGHRCPGLCGERCPDSRYCRDCCGQDILAQNVDMIEFRTYEDINVDEDPLVFLSCGHFYTASSLDGIMGMSDHYEMEQSTGKIIAPKLHRILDSGRPKGCPECRTPLRDIDRYNRIIKQAFLDEATKRFATQASARFANLVGEVGKYETEIEHERAKFVRDWSQEAVETRDVDEVKRSIDDYRKSGNRLLKRIKEFTKSVAKSEQPFGRVNSIFASAAARRDMPAASFQFNESDIQTGFQSRGHVLSLRLTWILFWDLDSIYSNNTIDPRIRGTLRQVVRGQLAGLLSKCLALASYCHGARFLQQEVESRIYHVLFSMLSLSNRQAQGNPVDGPTEASIRAKALEELKACEQMCLCHEHILGSLREDIVHASILVNGGTFYSSVTTEERRQVYQAMAPQFSGTGHWYYCENNHPFTVGECGMPMEEARCPQCDAPVGGINHQLAPGIRRADDMDVEFGPA
ncbi:P-loop containing nucleoside triphosphate hydrolase protein [Aspergillus sclerotiicarbonarius CBS 121057]|uniref:P-loop containing nucleoside triphosphate hydrolase protein n=1 Tax=Aspergillus sclerotiicarbonarius (strain CBS 121057 / IBT 28362) TaxID=1448318 RepID=A0A319F283_ASPSB|nr:P-loop containing nucleoside triphosphate hydrolase protein [Aspergillus sclerotiicarbonarius CBS 121057]